MGHFIISPSSVRGAIAIPPSKSHTLRAILFAALAKGQSVIHSPLPSPDTEAMLTACRHFGAEIDSSSGVITVKGLAGRIAHAEDVINAGNSGLVFRLCTAVGALSSNPVVVTGDHSIRHSRPVQPLLEGLSQLGASTATMRGDGRAPVIVQGPLRAGTAVIDGADSQPVSALLIAAAFGPGAVDLLVKNAGEKPWVAMTLDWFDRLGISYYNSNFETYRLPGNSKVEGFSYTVPGDFSSAAFPLAAALVTGSELTLDNIDMEDAQGDKKLVELFRRMGAHIEVDPQRRCLHVRKRAPLHGVRVDINDMIDALPIVAVVGCYAEGETHIVNGAIARQKECDRIACIASELRKMGAHVEEEPDGLRVRRSALCGAEVHSHHDHRMAMALAVAALGADGLTKVRDAACAAKTYPRFAPAFQQLGVQLQEVP